MPFVKLDVGILESTLWIEDAGTRVVFITMLAMADAAGLCPATAPGIARRANLPLDDVKRSLAILEAPDNDSRSMNNDGRRIERVDGGYLLVNYGKYREKDYTSADRQRRYRERHKSNGVSTVTNRDSNDESHKVTHAEAEAEAESSGRATRSRATCFSLSELPIDWRAFCQAERPDIDPDRAFAKFRDYWTAKGGKEGRKLDWLATWRNWVRDERALRVPTKDQDWMRNAV